MTKGKKHVKHWRVNLVNELERNKQIDELVDDLFNNKIEIREMILNNFEKDDRIAELEKTNLSMYWTASDIKYENLKLEQQNNRYRNLLESLSDTHDIASEIMKEQPDKKIIDANDILQYILRKINDELERVS